MVLSGSYTRTGSHGTPLLVLPPSREFVLTQVRATVAERNPELNEYRLTFEPLDGANSNLSAIALVNAACVAAQTRRYGPASRVEVQVFDLKDAHEPVDIFTIAIGRPSSQAGLRDDDAPPGPRVYRQAPWELPNQARVDELSLIYPDLNGERGNVKIPGVVPTWTRPDALSEGVAVRVVSISNSLREQRDYATDSLPTCSALAELELHRALAHCGVCPVCFDNGQTGKLAIDSAVFDDANRLVAVGHCECGQSLEFHATMSLSGSKPPSDYWQTGWRHLGSSSSQTLFSLTQALRRNADTPFRPTAGERTPESFVYEALCDLIDSPQGCDEATFTRVLQSIGENQDRLGMWATYLATLKRGDYVRSFPGRGRARAYNSRVFFNPTQLQGLLKLAHGAVSAQHPEWYDAAAESPSDEAVISYLLDAIKRYPGIRALARPRHDASQVDADWYVVQQVEPAEFMLLEDLGEHLAASTGKTGGNWGLKPGDLMKLAQTEYHDATRLGRLRIAADKVNALTLADPEPFLVQLTIQQAQTNFARQQGELPKANLKIQRELMMAGTADRRAQLTSQYETRPQSYPRNWGTHLRRELAHLAQLTDPEFLGSWPETSPETSPEHWRLFVIEQSLSPADAATATDDRVYRYLGVNPQGEMYLSRRYWLAAHQPDFGLMNEVEGANELRDRSGAFRREQDDDALRFELSRIYGDESPPSLNRGELHRDHRMVIA